MLGQYQCDDGNNLDGDGCSRNCTIEVGYTCINGQRCYDITAPEPKLDFIRKTDFNLYVLLHFTEPIDGLVEQNVEVINDWYDCFDWTMEKLPNELTKYSAYEISITPSTSFAQESTLTLKFKDPKLVHD